jgi:hypothetical protein
VPKEGAQVGGFTLDRVSGDAGGSGRSAETTCTAGIRCSPLAGASGGAPPVPKEGAQVGGFTLDRVSGDAGGSGRGAVVSWVRNPSGRVGDAVGLDSELNCSGRVGLTGTVGVTRST